MDSAIRIHSENDARAALRAAAAQGCAVTLVSAAGAAGYAGAGYFAALVAAARSEFPDVAVTAILDCGAAPGHVLGALRAGHRHVRFSGNAETAAKLTEIAQAQGAELITAEIAALDLARSDDAHAACVAWLKRTADG